MLDPIIDTTLLHEAWACPVLVVVHRQQSIRMRELHAHQPGQLIGSLTGLLSILTPRSSWIVPATHAVWIPSEIPHGLRSHGDFEGWTVYVAQEACSNLPPQPQTVRVSPLLRELVLRHANLADDGATDRAQRLAEVLLDEIASAPAEPLGLSQPSDPRVRRITDNVLADLRDDRPMTSWASWAGISPRTLARRMVDETGIGFSEWRQRARALRAIEMLAEGAAVTTIAIDLGYENISAFIAMFRRVFGTTPGRYLLDERQLR